MPIIATFAHQHASELTGMLIIIVLAQWCANDHCYCIDLLRLQYHCIDLPNDGIPFSENYQAVKFYRGSSVGMPNTNCSILPANTKSGVYTLHADCHDINVCQEVRGSELLG